MTDLRKLAESATPGPWEVKDTGDIYRLDVQDQYGSVVCLVPQVAIDDDGEETEKGEWAARTWNDAAFIAATSPDVVLGLLDRIDELEASNKTLFAKLGEAIREMEEDAERYDDDATKLYRERDETREAVRRLAGALEEVLDWDAPFGEGWDREWQDDYDKAKKDGHVALADPVVRRIVEGG